MRRATLASAVVAAAISFVTAAPALAGVQVGASGWVWGNPLPQGNTVRALSFAGLNGWMAPTASPSARRARSWRRATAG